MIPKSASSENPVCELVLMQAFPFHFVINDSGMIVKCGASLRRIIDINANGTESLHDHFVVQHPTDTTTVDELKLHQNTFFLIRSFANPKLLLRGQLIASTELGQCYFLVAPWVTELDVLDELGLTLSDFPLHSPMSDFLTLVQAQRASLADSKRLSDELRNLNRELEQRVDRRTQALEQNAGKLRESNQKLEHEINERARVEVELRHANKLEAVGQLAAGIAHEINTPIQYVGNSLQYLKSALSELQSFSQSVEDYLIQQSPHSAASRAELELVLSDIDLAHIKKRAPKAIDRALDGIDRVTNIVRAMNEFSYPDGEEKTSADINKALETTLTVAKSEYKYVAKIVKEFNPLPLVHCYPGDLNQVFLNLIVNAAHAISDHAGKDGIITIRTTTEQNNDVLISVSDNGAGIPEGIQNRVFDPFFTTKEVGRGTGQGLAISHNIIVNKHAGRLSFTTEPGRGTTFQIKLPVTGARAIGDTTANINSEDLAA